MSDLLEAALAYQQCGLSVLAWSYRERAGKWDKVPTKRWAVGVIPKADEAYIRGELWGETPDANVGIITGFVSNLVVVDADDEEAEDWCRKNLPPTPYEVTTGRGRHFGYQYPELGEGEKLKTTSKIGCKHKNKTIPRSDPLHKECFLQGALCGLDIRADGGYASAPPSLHKSGRTYEWETEAEDLPGILDNMPVFDPAWLPNTSVEKEHVANDLVDWNAPPSGNTDKAAVWLAGQPGAVAGNNGRSQTFKVAAGLVRDFALSPKEALTLMTAYNRRCSPPWTEPELCGKIEDAWLKGTSQIGGRVALDVESAMNAPAAPAPTVLTPAAQRLKDIVSQKVPETNQEPESQAVTSPGAAITDPSEHPDDQFIRELTAETSRDAGAPYQPINMATTIRFSKDSPVHLARLEAALKGLINMVAWKKAIREGRTKERTASTGGNGLSTEDRVEVSIGDARATRDGILAALNNCAGIYVTAGKLAYADKSAKMVELHGGHLRNIVVDNCNIVNKSEEGTKSVSLPTDVLSMLEGLLPEQIDKFRVVNQITKAPFFNKSGTLVFQSGYDEESKTLLCDAPEGIDPEMFATSAEAINFIYTVFHEFKFQTMAEFANYLGAMLTPMMRPMYSGPTPWLIIEANTPGSGKTLLADCLQIIYGYQPTRHVLSYKEEEIEKKMLTILQATVPIVLFDNVKHAVDSPTLEAIATSGDEYQGRLLGKNEDRVCPVRQLFIITSNNATMSVDAARRFLRVRLCRTGPATTTTGDQHRFEVKDLRAYVEQLRPQILSALIKIVSDWLAADRPVADSVPLLPSFEVFCEHVGAAMHYAGRTDWLANFEEAKRAFSVNDDWSTFIATWFEEFKETQQTDQTLLALTQRHGLLSGLLSKATDQATKLAVFKRSLNNLRDYDDGQFRVNVVMKSNTKTVYSVEKSKGEA